MTNIPVWDIGPFNIYDDYWNPNYVYVNGNQFAMRNTWGYAGYGNLPRGSSEAWYSYQYNFHNGWTSSCPYNGMNIAYISDSNPGTQCNRSKANPKYPSNIRSTGASIDLSDGVMNYLGLTGNTNVAVTFNWTS
jgi:hypothetical protein